MRDKELRKDILDELDFEREASNAQRFAEKFGFKPEE